MRTIAYARLPGDKEREEFKVAVKDFLATTPLIETRDAEFEFDGLAGQLGLTETIRRAHSPGVGALIVQRFSDLGRDIASAIRTAHELLFTARIDLYVMQHGLSISNAKAAPDESAVLLTAIYDALGYYATLNRKVGIETARASGAQIGRPRGIGYPDVREVLYELMNTRKAAGKPFPSVRDAAKKIAERFGKCSMGKASEFLKQLRSEVFEPTMRTEQCQTGK